MKTHGLSRTKEFKIWCGMKARCKYPSASDYALYGGRGIRVCERWENSVEAFLADMGRCPEGCSIDRIDPDGHYEPGNCRWLPIAQQSRNRRDNIVIEYQDESLTVAEWERKLGFADGTVRYRIKRGWSIHDALTVKPGTRNGLLGVKRGPYASSRVCAS